MPTKTPCLLSKPSKMPGASFGLSARDCKTGSKLALIPGSVCFDCYALKGNYNFKVVKRAHAYRLSLLDNLDAFIERMVTEITKATNKSGVPYFRWHDSGDIQSIDHLLAIYEVCRRTPTVSHWLPSKEYGMVRQVMRKAKTDPFAVRPSNCTLRMSAVMVDGPPPVGFDNTTTVHRAVAYTPGIECLAHENGNKCGDCRHCWDANISNISYLKH
mgnify:FL=1